jgi:hypothetical protein
MAGKPIGKVAMTATERQRKWRAKVRRRIIFGGNPDPSARRRAPARDDLDFWPTPECLRESLTATILPTLPPGPVWECAAGDGYLADAIAAAGREVVASDVNPQQSGMLRLDFLNDPPPLMTHGSILITNPPFGKSGLLDPFLDRTLALLDKGHLRGAVLLARPDAAGTAGRADTFNRAAAEYTCCWRPVWIPGTSGNGRWWFTWFVWLADRRGPPVHYRLRRPSQRDNI